MVLIAIIIGFTGLCLGSFVNAFVWRLHKKRDWVKERSECTHCGHILAAKDLIPVLSWLMLRGKCRYCNKQIDDSPLVELGLGLAFALSYAYWPHTLGTTGQLALFTAWLVSLVGLAALFLYDLKWMLLPTKIIYTATAVAAAGNIIYLLSTPGDAGRFLLNWVLSVLVASGIFFALYVLSRGKWIGYGDVRLGLLTGTLLHSPSNAFLMIFLASVLGTLYVLPSLINKKRTYNARLPYGPFLILASVVCVLFGSSLINWYFNLLSI